MSAAKDPSNDLVVVGRFLAIVGLLATAALVLVFLNLGEGEDTTRILVLAAAAAVVLVVGTVVYVGGRIVEAVELGTETLVLAGRRNAEVAR